MTLYLTEVGSRANRIYRFGRWYRERRLLEKSHLILGGDSEISCHPNTEGYKEMAESLNSLKRSKRLLLVNKKFIGGFWL